MILKPAASPQTNPEIVLDLVNETANVMATRLSNQLKS